MPTEPDESISLGTLTVTTGENPDACVIWLHGLGADGHDFEDIVPQLMLPTSLSIRFLFPDAPFRSVTINGGYMMRAWYDIFEDFSENAEQDRQGIIETCQVMSLLIDQQIEGGIDSQRIILAGFSQGGAIALYTGLNLNKPLAGILALSSYLPLANELPCPIKSSNKNVDIFMGHGKQDPLVPFQYGFSTKEHLGKCGPTVDWHEYDMQHSVCAEEIMDIREWLIARLS
ncbi:MAG: carboxylesterase [Gammaproteobacteria bacterium]|nr:MAG: carboxylesterase [Gammaproteobacteria bacterium]